MSLEPALTNVISEQMDVIHDFSTQIVTLERERDVLAIGVFNMPKSMLYLSISILWKNFVFWYQYFPECFIWFNLVFFGWFLLILVDFGWVLLALVLVGQIMSPNISTIMSINLKNNIHLCAELPKSEKWGKLNFCVKLAQILCQTSFNFVSN